MPSGDQRRIHLRGFISLLTALSFLIMAVSGIMLFLVPQGRIAYWTDWRMMGITKAQWGDMHISTSLLFVLAGVWHIVLNWRLLVSYFHDKARKTVALKGELAIAAVITLFFTVGAVCKTPPLSYILQFNDYLKASWVKGPEYEPPFGHAELLSLESFLKKVDIQMEPAMDALKKNGIKVTGSEEKVADLARNNGTSPAAIYKLLKHLEQKPKLPVTGLKEPKPLLLKSQSTKADLKQSVAPEKKPVAVWTADQVLERFEGKGVGRKTLSEICGELGLNQDEVIRKLAAKRIAISGEDTMKQAANRAGELPIELLKMILVGEPLKQ